MLDVQYDGSHGAPKGGVRHIWAGQGLGWRSEVTGQGWGRQVQNPAKRLLGAPKSSGKEKSREGGGTHSTKHAGKKTSKFSIFQNVKVGG